MRLFVALPIPDTVREELGRRAEEARQTLPNARWVDPKTIHLTLTFLGETDPKRLPFLKDHLAEAFAASPRFELTVGKPGTFPSSRSAKVAWVAVDGGEDLAPLQERVAEAAVAAGGIDPDPRPFHPHLTVARCKRPWRSHDVSRFVEHFQGPKGDPFLVTEGVLYESELTPSGARHHRVETFPLGGEDEEGPER